MARLESTWGTRQCDLPAPAGHPLAAALREPIESPEGYQRLGTALERFSTLSEEGLGPEWAPVLTDRVVEAAAWRVWQDVDERSGLGFTTPVVTLVYCPRNAMGWDRVRFERMAGHPDPASGKVSYSTVAWPYAGTSRQSILSAQDMFWDPLPVPLLLNLMGASMKVRMGGAIGMMVPSAKTWDEACMELFGATPASSRLERSLPPPQARPKSRF